MKKFLLLFIASVILIIGLSTTRPLAEDLINSDVSGKKDIPSIKRLENSVLLDSANIVFDEYLTALGKVEFDYNSQDYKPWEKLKLEGNHSYAFYRMPKGVSTLEPLRSYQDELTNQGFETLFSGSGEELDNGFGRFVSQVYGKKVDGALMEYILPAATDFRYIALRKNREDGGQTVFTALFIKVPDSWKSKFGDVGDVIGRIDLLETKTLNKRLVLIKAEEINQQLDTRGSVSLYGILFDFNKAEIKPESFPALEEVAKYLTTNPIAKLVITGHTDNAGNFEFNRNLSEKRALSVVDYLVSKHNINKDRLVAFGASFAAPIASNSDEAGKAKNRRVEIVKF